MPRAQPQRKQTDLEAELWQAICAGRRVDLLEALGISPTLMTIAGCDFVAFLDGLYQPDPDGVAALIVGVVDREEPAGVVEEITAIDLATGIAIGPVVEQPGGSFVYDLVAIELEGERVGTRLGWAALLGEDAVAAARERPLKLLTPRQWVREPDDAAAIIDWRRAPYLLQDCGGIECGSLSLARRVRRAFDQPLGRPPLSVIVDDEPALEPAL